ncbi:MAG: hypothetical protein EBR82_14425 [Caulobacteraceae bacterium]|nr:hypothetical protein [Caulobacteraceae bacterium]
MNKISTFSYKGKDIDMLYDKGNLAYTFEHEGKQYGYKVEVPSKSVLDIASTSFLLFINVVETLEALKFTPNENI